MLYLYVCSDCDLLFAFITNEYTHTKKKKVKFQHSNNEKI